MRLKLVVLALASLSAYAQGFDGWGKVAWGASAQEIQAAYPEATLAGDKLVIPNYLVGDDAFQVQMTVASDGLASVSLISSIGDCPLVGRKGMDRAVQLSRLSIRLERMLAEKYGPPTRGGAITLTPYLGTTEWIFAGSNIVLTVYHDTTSSTRSVIYTMRLRYERKSKALDKL